MKKYKVSCDWNKFTFVNVLLPTISFQRIWMGFAIGFIWLKFEFVIEFKEPYEIKYKGMPFTGENSVIITKIETEENK